MENDINISLWNSFNDIMFDEKTHSYINSKNDHFISVTQLIDKFVNPFNEEEVAKKVAIKKNCDYKKLIEEWKNENKYSCELGTAIHSRMENLWNKKYYEPNFNNQLILEDYNLRSDKCLKLFNKLKSRFIPVKTEYIVYDNDSKIAGSIDLLVYDKITNSYMIFDYKTNKSIIMFPNKYSVKMKDPFNELYDINFEHYCIQLSFYKSILEKNCKDIKISEMYLLHIPNINNPLRSYKCRDYSDLLIKKFLVNKN